MCYLDYIKTLELKREEQNKAARLARDKLVERAQNARRGKIMALKWDTEGEAQRKIDRLTRKRDRDELLIVRDEE